MERLTISNGKDWYGKHFPALPKTAEQAEKEGFVGKFIDAVKDITKRLAHYEDMEEQGRFVILPCKTGDTIYDADFAENVVYDDCSFGGIAFERIHNGDVDDYIPLSDIGKIEFTTREAAQAELQKHMAQAAGTICGCGDPGCGSSHGDGAFPAGGASNE